MDETSGAIRRVAEEELERLLAEREAAALQEEPDGPAVGRLPRPLTWSLEMAGAILLGLLCGVLSHAAVFFLARALG